MDMNTESITSMDSYVETSEQLHFTDSEELNETSQDFSEGLCELWQEPDFTLGASETYIVARQESETGSLDTQKRNVAKLCRLCAFPAEQTVYIFGEEGLKQGLRHKINSSLPVTVNITDPLPKQVCLPCISKLNMMYEFSESCVGIEEKLNFSVKSKVFRSKIILSKTMELVERTSNNTEDFMQHKNNLKKHTDNTKESIITDGNMGYSCPFCSSGKMVAYQNNSVASNENVHSESKSNRFFYFYKDVKEQMWTKSCVSLEQNASDEFSITTVNPQKLSCASSKEEKLLAISNSSDTFSVSAWNAKRENSTQKIKLDGIQLKKTSCQICGELFQRFSLCQIHSRIHTNKNNFPCILCGECFSNEAEWMTHFKQHEMNEKSKSLNTPCSVMCSDCGALFNSYVAFDEHSCPNYVACKCNKCSKYFISQAKLQLHMDSFHNIGTFCGITEKENLKNSCEYLEDLSKFATQFSISDFSCSQCLQNFKTELELVQHLEKGHNTSWSFPFKEYEHDPLGLHVSQTQVLTTKENSSIDLVLSSPNKHRCYKCNVCNEIFLNSSFANTHVMQHSCEIKDKQIHHIKVAVVYVCEFCEKLFVNKHSLKEHIASHGKEPLYMCKFCSASFSSYNRAAKHRSTHLKDSSSSIPAAFVCFDCDTCFLQWTSLYYHRKTFHEPQCYECYPCKLSFESVSLLHKHKDNFHYNSVLGVQDSFIARKIPYLCSICGETFQLKSAYNKHQRKHEGFRPFMCDVCGKSFTQNSGLYTHRRVHTGEKPYPCNFCERTFRLKHDRDNHHRCHTGERPFKCSCCEKAFRTSHDHRQHLLIHTGERPYGCDYCGKGFRRINGLNVHKRIHTGEKPYTCHTCGRRFTQKGDMIKHNKTQHPPMFDTL